MCKLRGKAGWRTIQERKGDIAQAQESELNILLIGEPGKEMLSAEIIWSETFFLTKNCKIK